jgi:hypothetical protein
VNPYESQVTFFPNYFRQRTPGYAPVLRTPRPEQPEDKGSGQNYDDTTAITGKSDKDQVIEKVTVLHFLFVEHELMALIDREQAWQKLI